MIRGERLIKHSYSWFSMKSISVERFIKIHGVKLPFKDRRLKHLILTLKKLLKHEISKNPVSHRVLRLYDKRETTQNDI